MKSNAFLDVRPGKVMTISPKGLLALPLGRRREGYCYVPAHYDPVRPSPLVLLLHGAGGDAHHGLEILKRFSDERGLILVAPASTRATWDIIVEGRFGADVTVINDALDYMFEYYAVDATAIAIGGFSDGASYALSLGLPNGGLFTHVMGFSPGFIHRSTPRGRPKIFITHGTEDQVLPIAYCSRKIVPKLKADGYDVTYREFTGGHVIPPDIARSAIDWMLQSA